MPIRKLLLSLAVAGLAGFALWKVAAAPSPARLGAASLVEAAPQWAGEPIVPLPESVPLDPRKIALGQRLFGDPRLSKDDSVACASCHALDKGGADGRRRPVGIGGREGRINSPTVFNSGFNFVQFWDGRAASLEDQVDGPTHSPDEMGSSWPEIVAKIGRDASYAREFAEIYGVGRVRPAQIKDAIATFERSLVTPNSPFDRYLKGERTALTPAQIEGYAKFRSYGCVACHQGANVGGNLYARLGVMADFFKDRGSAEPRDLGRFRVTGAGADTHVFKVPSLRNVARTAPYLHDGSAETLEQAVDIMGRYQLGIAIPPADVALIVEFLQTLTGEYQGRPL